MKSYTDQDIKKAEYQKLIAETGKVKAEKDKIDLEKSEIKKELEAPFYRKKKFWPTFLSALGWSFNPILF
jgi:hypothetical protein